MVLVASLKFGRCDAITAVILALMAGLLLFSFPPAYQHWDALVYAYRAQTAQLAPSLYSHHALSNLLYYGATRALLGLHVVDDSIRAFQATSAGLGGLMAGLAYFLARTWRNSRLLALCLAAMLVTSYGFWHFAGTADLYGWISLVTLLFWGSAAAALVEPTVRNLILAGALAGIAILSWQPNAWPAMIFGVANMVDAARGGRSFIRPLLYFALPGITVLVLGYGALGWLAGAHQASEFIDWFVGYFGSPSYGGLLNWTTFPIVRDSAQRAVLTPPYQSGPYRLVWGGMWLAIAFMLLGAGLGWRRLGQKHKALLWVNLVWLAGLALAAWWFDPYSPKFWLVTWLGVVLTMMLGFVWWSEWHVGRWPLGSALVATVTAGLWLYNFMVGIQPEHRIRNYQIEAAQLWRQATQPDDLLLVGRDFRMYLDYYADRHHVINPESVYDAVSNLTARNVAGWIEQALDVTQQTGVAIYRAAEVCETQLIETTGWCSAEMQAVLDRYDWQPAFQTFDGHTRRVVFRGFPPRQPGSSDP